MQNDIRDWVKQHGDMLFRYALARVGNRTDAEDLVQETFLAALQSKNKDGGFAGRSLPQSWLVGILRHKIMDFYRKLYRSAQLPDTKSESDSDDDTGFDSMFDSMGMWKQPVADWGETPESLLSDKDFDKILKACLARLPDQQRAAFVLRTMEEKSSDDICKDCSVSTTNLGVLLFRARTQLRRCLEGNWFGQQGAKA